MEQRTRKNNKKLLILGTLVLALLVAAFAFVYGTQQSAGQTGAKTITITIVTEDASKTESIQTDAEFLRGALEQEQLVSGTESEFGLYILTVDGVTADETQQQWWCITKGGETVYTGVDTTPIADGDAFELTLMTGW